MPAHEGSLGKLGSLFLGLPSSVPQSCQHILSAAVLGVRGPPRLPVPSGSAVEEEDCRLCLFLWS